MTFLLPAVKMSEIFAFMKRRGPRKNMAQGPRPLNPGLGRGTIVIFLYNLSLSCSYCWAISQQVLHNVFAAHYSASCSATAKQQ